MSISASLHRSRTLSNPSILAQANDKWKPITLADGAFDLDELKKDISSADAKFSVRKYKPTALILEYLVSRASKQGIAAPPFATAKPNSGKTKRGAVEDGKRPQKRFQGGRQRQQYTMEQDLWEEDSEVMNDEADWGENQEFEEEAAEDWDFYAFQQSSSSFSPCNTARTRTSRIRTPLRGVTNCTHQKEKERHPKVGVLFISLKALKAKARGKEKARANRAKAKAIAREKA